MSMCLEVHVTVGIRTFTDKKYSKKYFFCQIILTDRGVVDYKFYFCIQGLFPDVGGGYMLPRMKGKLGLYLALTGEKNWIFVGVFLLIFNI